MTQAVFDPLRLLQVLVGRQQLDERDFLGWRTIHRFDTVGGRLDVIPATPGVGRSEQFRSGAVVVDLDGVQVLAASLDAIIASKEAVGRPKDRRRLLSLIAFRERLRRRASTPDRVDGG